MSTHLLSHQCQGHRKVHQKHDESVADEPEGQDTALVLSSELTFLSLHQGHGKHGGIAVKAHQKLHSKLVTLWLLQIHLCCHMMCIHHVTVCVVLLPLISARQSLMYVHRSDDGFRFWALSWSHELHYRYLPHYHNEISPALFLDRLNMT